MVSSASYSFFKKLFFICSLILGLAGSSQAFARDDLDGWEEIFPGGETRCARGEPFSFFVNKGTSGKVVVDFIGGGACWNAQTCSREGATFVDSVDMVRNIYKQGPEGVYNHKDLSNPLHNWTHVVVPYCTGDIHWGEHDKVYTKENGESFTIYHRGAINARAVLKWVKEQAVKPKKFLVTGCSAGSYGSIYWTPHFRKAFPNTIMTQMGDSGAGVITQDFLIRSFKVWQAQHNVANWIDGIDPRKVDWNKLTLNDLYHHIGHFYPSMKLGQFNYSHDENQIFFHELMGGDSDLWPGLMRGKINDLSNRMTNFDYYMADGEHHCILPYQRFHTEKSGKDGKLFKTWLMEHADHDGLSPFIRR